MTERTGLKVRDGQRFRCRAVVGRFGTKKGWNGTVYTILLTDVIDVVRGETLTDHVWFARGLWCAELRPGDLFEFDARATTYVKGYQGRRNVPEKPVKVDWRLSRPTKVYIVQRGTGIR